MQIPQAHPEKSASAPELRQRLQQKEALLAASGATAWLSLRPAKLGHYKSVVTPGTPLLVLK